MSGLLLEFIDGEGELVLKDGRLQTGNGLGTIVYTSEFSNARASEEDPTDPLNPKKFGYWAESLMAINGRRWGSRYWQFARRILTVNENENVVNDLQDVANECTQHLLDNGIVESITPTTQRAGVDRVYQEVVFQEPGNEEPTRVTFRNLWDDIRKTL